MPCLGDGHSSSQRLPRGVRRTGIQVEGGSRNTGPGAEQVCSNRETPPLQCWEACVLLKYVKQIE